MNYNLFDKNNQELVKGDLAHNTKKLDDKKTVAMGAFSEFNSEEQELKHTKRKNLIITIIIVVLFAYLVYRLLFKPDALDPELSNQEYVLPDLKIEPPAEKIIKSDIGSFEDQISDSENLPPTSNFNIQEKQESKVENTVQQKKNTEKNIDSTNNDLTLQEVQSEKQFNNQLQNQDSEKDVNNFLDSVFYTGDSSSVQKNAQAEKIRIQERMQARKKSSLVLLSSENSSSNLSEDNHYDLYLTLRKGKIIEVVVENAINTDYGGEVRAVITQNIFSEWGKNILIPQGSRIFGEYSKGVTDKTGRLFINWTRLDLPTGYKITFEGDAVDNLGLLGINGQYDRKLLEQITNAFLLSAFDIGIAYGLDKLIEPVQGKDSSQARNALLQVQSARDQLSTIENNTALTTNVKIDQICSSVLALIDMTSQSYLNLSNYCKEVKTSLVSSDEESKYRSLINRFNSELDQLLVINNQNTEETQIQSASKEAYNDLTDSLKNLLFESQNWEPTVALVQGTKVKIYVRQDYQLPKNALLDYEKVLFIK